VNKILNKIKALKISKEQKAQLELLLLLVKSFRRENK